MNVRREDETDTELYWTVEDRKKLLKLVRNGNVDTLLAMIEERGRHRWLWTNLKGGGLFFLAILGSATGIKIAIDAVKGWLK